MRYSKKNNIFLKVENYRNSALNVTPSMVPFLILISPQRSSNGTNRYRFDVYETTSDYPPNMSTFGFNHLGILPREISDDSSMMSQ